MLRKRETYFEKHRNTNWLISQEALDDITYNVPELAGSPFSLDEVQNAVKVLKSRKALGADRITVAELTAGE